MKKVFKKGFTLAEVMIVLTVIGILAGILIPIANNSRPDENVMKFKKAHATLANVIHELVTSDKYYQNGDLGIKADGTLIDGTHVGDKSYFCSTFADILSTKSQNCSDLETKSSKGSFISDWNGDESNGNLANLKAFRQAFDNTCKNYINLDINAVIITNDNIKYTFIGSCEPFGAIATKSNGYDMNTFCGSSSEQSCRTFLFKNKLGFYGRYREACITIGNESFGYGIRVDGKIIPGAKAMEWLEKGFQKGKNEN